MMEPTDTPDLTSTQTASSSLRSPRGTYLDDETHEEHHEDYEKQFASTDEQFLSLLPPTLTMGSGTEHLEEQLMVLEDQEEEQQQADDNDDDDGSSATSLVLNHDEDQQDDMNDPPVRIFHVDAGRVSFGDAGASCNEAPKKFMFCLLEDTTTTTTATTTTTTSAATTATPDVWTESSKSRVLYRQQSSDCLNSAAEDCKEKSMSFIDWIMPSHSYCSAFTVLEAVWEGGASTKTSTTTTEALGDEVLANAHALQELSRAGKKEQEEEKEDTIKESDWFWFPVDDGRRNAPTTPPHAGDLAVDSSSTPSTTTASATLTPLSRGTLRRNISKRTSFVLPPAESLPSSPPLSSSSLRHLTREFSRRGSEFTRWDSIALSQGDCAWDMDGADSDDFFFAESPPTSSTFVTNRSLWRSAFAGVGKMPCSRVYAKPRDLSWSDSGGGGRRVATQATRRQYWW